MKNKNYSAPDLKAALEVLREYKRGKAALEARLSSEHEFWKNRYGNGTESSSWLFNSIVSKHADIIDNMPTCTCLPREECDEKDAALLSQIIPIILERSNFKSVYSDNSWNKLKYGAAIYGVFWNNMLEDGLGDIDIRALRAEDVFWESGVTDIQESKNLFICRVLDSDVLENVYGVRYEDIKKESDALAHELYGGLLDMRGKCVVVDWYYKKFDENGVQRLHLCKFCAERVLYCSEENGGCSEGWYTHGKYPVIFDSLYPDESSIFGFGVISVARNAQNAIDRIDKNIMEYADWSSKARFWAKKSLGVNERDFRDLSHSIVEVEGDIDDEKLKQIEIAKLDEMVLELRSLKIDELKETTGTRDFLQGGTTGGVVAATAIKRLQDYGAKFSRDGIDGSCRMFSQLITLVIELIRQFYDTPRYYRIKGECGEGRYVCYSGIKNTEKSGEGKLSRRPHFDLEITTQKRSQSYTEEANAFAKELYESGAFKPENSKEALIMLELMNFDGMGKIRKMLEENGLQNHD